jgi:hypothetical protein
MSAPLALALVALVVALSALGLVAWSTSVRRRDSSADTDSPLPTDVAGLRDEVERLRRSAAGALRKPVVVRYDAFGDMGGRLSWSLALVDRSGDGVVLTSIHGRSDARSYAKALQDWVCEQPLSPEEEKAVEAARDR